ncbi:hypothetical protein GCM10011579_034100 [Streptomyces albiflavescens]|uniref:Transposase n=1 Tax=Streptomyces albiflavescens TaxID=1623582 RepID=A0A918D4E2_9ACTN|nr:hypothetical protein GCM10011579_034100 [Streptomyces albiflavescens]
MFARRVPNHDADLHKERNTVERLINKLLAWGGIATRSFAWTDCRDLITLPSYAADPNPVEGIWPISGAPPWCQRAFSNPAELSCAVRRGLRQLQYRSDVLDGCLTGTGRIPARPR